MDPIRIILIKIDSKAHQYTQTCSFEYLDSHLQWKLSRHLHNRLLAACQIAPSCTLSRALSTTHDWQPFHFKQDKLIQALARLALHHEQSINAYSLDTDLMIYTATGSGSIVPELAQTAVQWRTAFQKRQITKSLRMILLTLLTRELHSRLKQIHASSPQDPLKASLVQKGYIQNGAWQFLNEQALSFQEVDQIMEDIMGALQKRIINRFQGLRSLQNTGNEVIPWKLSISIRTDRGKLFFQQLSKLVRSACTQVVLMRVKNHTLHTSLTASAVYQLLQTNSRNSSNQGFHGKGKGKGKSDQRWEPSS